jgi:DNA-binding MarR family transcriptional regulator
VFESEDNISELQDSISNADHDHVDRVLAQWAKVRPDLDTAPVAVIARLGRATAYVDAGINARLAEFGLSRAAWDVLASLRRNGPPYRLSPTQLYVALMRSSGAMTHRVYGLERAELVTRVPDPDDARGMLVELTPKGIALVDRVAPVHLANEHALLQSLSDDEQGALADLLRKLLLGLEQQQPAPLPSGRGGRRPRHARHARKQL